MQKQEVHRCQLCEIALAELNAAEIGNVVFEIPPTGVRHAAEAHVSRKHAARA